MSQEFLPLDVSSLNDEVLSLANQVITEQDPEKAQHLISLFNWSLSKKNTNRILLLNDLYDNVTEQMITRFKTKADQFSNADLLDYLKVVQGAIDTSTRNLSTIEQPPTIVQNNNTQINVSVIDTLDRDAKERVLAAINATIKAMRANPVESTATDVTPVDTDAVIDELESVVDDK